MGITSRPVDWSKLGTEILGVLKDAGSRLLSSDRAEELTLYYTHIQQRLVLALQEPDEAKAAEAIRILAAQAQMVGELNRVRAVNDGWDTVGSVIQVIGQTALGALKSVKVV